MGFPSNGYITINSIFSIKELNTIVCFDRVWNMWMAFIFICSRLFTEDYKIIVFQLTGALVEQGAVDGRVIMAFLANEQFSYKRIIWFEKKEIEHI